MENVRSRIQQQSNNAEEKKLSPQEQEALRTRLSEIEQLDEKSKELPPQEQSLLRSRLAEIDKEYKEQKGRLEFGELAEKLGQAISQAAAGYYGMKTGYNMSGLKFDKTDWASKMDQALGKYKTDVQSLTELEKEAGVAERSRKQLEALDQGYQEQREFKAQEAEKARQARLELAAQKAAQPTAAAKKQPTISDKQAQTLLDLDNTAQAYDVINKKLNTAEDWRNYVGPIRGRLPDEAVGPEEARFRVEMNQLFNEYRKAITGAAASAQELRFLEKAIPSIKDKPDNFKAKVEELQNILKRKRDTQLGVLESQGKDVTAFKKQQAATSVPATKSPRQELEELRALKKAQEK